METDYLQIEKDALNDCFSMSLMANKIIVNHVFKDQNSITEAIFSNAGFTYGFPEKVVQQPGENPTFFFTQKSTYKEIQFLEWLGTSAPGEYSLKISD